MEALENIREEAVRFNRPYLRLEFRHKDKGIVAEVDDGIYMEFEISHYQIGDDGVGSFEYHGFKGNHSRPFLKVTDITVISVNGKPASTEICRMMSEDFKAGLITAKCDM